MRTRILILYAKEAKKVDPAAIVIHKSLSQLKSNNCNYLASALARRTKGDNLFAPASPPIVPWKPVPGPLTH